MDTIAQIDAFFAGKPQKWALFEEIRKYVCSAHPETSLRVMKTCISFDDPKPYLYVSFPKRKSDEGLLLTISLQEAMSHPRFAMVVPVSKNRFTVHIPVKDISELDKELLSLIALSRR